MGFPIEKWIEAKKRFRLSQMHIQMAMELGLNPTKFGKIANHQQEPWKAPLPQFLEEIYLKRFKRAEPLVVKSFIEMNKGKSIAPISKPKKVKRKEGSKNPVKDWNTIPRFDNDLPF